MSNLQTVKSLYEAFAHGNLAAVLASMDERMEWREPDTLPYEDQVGPKAIAENVFARVVEDVSDFSVTPEEFVDGGDTVVSLGRYRGRGSQTGIALDAPFAHVWRFRDGKIVYFRTYTDTKRWIDALGV